LPSLNQGELNRSNDELRAGLPGFDYRQGYKAFLCSIDRLWRRPSLLSNGYRCLLPRE
jgi:hypothetical protein